MLNDLIVTETRILIADDDQHILDRVEKVLAEQNAYPELQKILVSKSSTPEEAIEAASRFKPHVCVLDLVFKPVSEGGSRSEGLKLIEAINNISDCGIIVLSREPDDLAAPASISRGADFYIEKLDGTITKTNLLQFYVDKCASKAKEFVEDKEYFSEGDTKYSIGEYWFALGQRHLHANGQSIPLTHLEYSFLKLASQSSGRKCAIDDAYQEIYGEAFRPGDRKLANMISRLRKKLRPSADIVAESDQSYRIVD